MSFLSVISTTLAGPPRGKLLISHHSRLSCGQHGDNGRLDRLWRSLFDGNGAPLVGATFGGHDHNLSLYKSRGRDTPGQPAAAGTKGIHVLVNGAGGNGLYRDTKGSAPDVHDFDNFAVTRITLVSESESIVEVFGFGRNARAMQGLLASCTTKIVL